jgi:predicted Rossmann fold nucleotide-binding protein DprA/Smf involved in DNA uptake
MSVIRDTVETLKGRVADLEQQIGPLADEAEQLRTAIAKLEAIEPARLGRRTPSAAGARRTPTRRATQPTAPRAPRGQNRRAILDAIRAEAKTAGDVAKETGIGRPTVSTTLTKLVSDGAAVKAERGYKAA